MIQDTINQRLKFLIEKVSPNAKVFSETIEESPATTHNYIGKRQTEPRAQYLSKVLSHFADVDARWLMTGEGEPIVGIIDSGVGEPGIFYQSPTQNQKKNKGNIINHTGNGPTSYTLDDCARERDQLKQKCDAQEREIGLLKEIITLLKSQQPNSQ